MSPHFISRFPHATSRLTKLSVSSFEKALDDRDDDAESVVKDAFIDSYFRADGSGSAGCSVPALRCTNLTASRMTK